PPPPCSGCLRPLGTCGSGPACGVSGCWDFHDSGCGWALNWAHADTRRVATPHPASSIRRPNINPGYVARRERPVSLPRVSSMTITVLVPDDFGMSALAGIDGVELVRFDPAQPLPPGAERADV